MGIARHLALCVPNVPRRPSNSSRLYTLGLLFLKAAAMRASWDCTLLDAYFSNLNSSQSVARLGSVKPFSILGFCVHSKEMLDEALAIVRGLRERVNEPFRVLLGGFYASSQWATILNAHREVDFIAVGEGENVLEELLTSLGSGQFAGTIEGLFRRERAGKLSETRRRREHTDLDGLGSIDFSWCDESPAPGEWSLVTSRGCSARCSYCLIGQHWGHYGSWRGHSAEWVVTQVTRLVKEHGATALQFVDDEFVGSPQSAERALEISRLMRATQLNIPFGFMCRADTVCNHPRVFEQLRTVGLQTVFLGLESGNAEVLQILRKRCSLERATQAVEFLAELGVAVAGGTILFHPWMTRDTLRRDLEFFLHLLDVNPGFHFFDLNELDIFESTPLGAAYRRDEFTWRYDWKCPDVETARIFETWQRLQRVIFFPAFEKLPPRPALPLRRAINHYQIKILSRLVDEPFWRPDVYRLFLEMCLLVLKYAGPKLAGVYASGSLIADSEAEHCFA